MRAEIITIGDELLIGQVIDTNSAWIAQQLNFIGIEVSQIISISDNQPQIIHTLSEAMARNELILITGGLGPTNDDITKKALCEFFDTKLIFDEESFQQIKVFFKTFNLNVSGLNKSQSEIPANCKPVRNTCGTAPGMWFEKDNKVIISMPGVPYEMKTMMEESILPELKRRFQTSNVLHKTVLTQGIGESFLSEIIADWEKSLPPYINLAYLPSPGIVRLRMTVRGEDEEHLKNEINRQTALLTDLISEYIYGYDQDSLEEIIGNLLKAKGKTLATAESCTGGYLAHLITSVPGSSAYYKGSVICYANEIKTKILGVREKTIEKYGAVSSEVVNEMASGLLKLMDTDYAISISGIAGPEGGSSEKPVGTTWVAIAHHATIHTFKYSFGENRERNIKKAAITALNLLRKELLAKQ